MLKQAMSVVPTGAVLGAQIVGVDVSKDLDDATFRRIDDAFNEHGVIFFRDQRITEDQQIRFARRFGELEINVNTEYGLPQHPEMLLVSNIVDNGRYIGLADAGRTWHTDMSAYARPPRCSLLYAREIPHGEDGQPLGDTLFASAAAAYDALAQSTKDKLADLRASHSYLAKMKAREKAVGLTRKITEEHLAKTPTVLHPIFRTHPVTGRKCIYVTEGECASIEGIPDDEALAIISELQAHLLRPEFQYRHKWRVGDLLMWDNCTCQHLAIKDYDLPQRRLMHRVTVNGSVPF